jgi:DNA invertase Pin-like site-specific DNA recombinase
LQVQVIPEQEPEETEPVLEEEKRPARSRGEEQARLARRAQKLDRDPQVLELREQGLTAAAIGSRIGISGRTVQRWLAHGSLTASQTAAQTTQPHRSDTRATSCDGGKRETAMAYSSIEP